MQQLLPGTRAPWNEHQSAGFGYSQHADTATEAANGKAVTEVAIEEAAVEAITEAEVAIALTYNLYHESDMNWLLQTGQPLLLVQQLLLCCPTE